MERGEPSSTSWSVLGPVFVRLRTVQLELFEENSPKLDGRVDIECRFCLVVDLLSTSPVSRPDNSSLCRLSSSTSTRMPAASMSASTRISGRSSFQYRFGQPLGLEPLFDQLGQLEGDLRVLGGVFGRFQDIDVEHLDLPLSDPDNAR